MNDLFDVKVESRLGDIYNIEVQYGVCSIRGTCIVDGKVKILRLPVYFERDVYKVLMNIVLIEKENNK